ncbi:MAG: hypothetical protein GXY52_11380 [Chloroflexi bacterium]|nr:hypothetical protein [Chloroflexota bacterium]
MAENPPDLSDRELELLELLVTGATNQQIAHRLYISVNTVKTHLRNIFGKLGVESRTEATNYALRHNLVTGAVPAADTAAPARSTPADLAGVPVYASLLAVALLILAIVGAMLWPAAPTARGALANPFVDEPAPPSSSLSVGSRRWQRAGSLSQPRARFAQAVINGNLYLVGGLEQSGASAGSEVWLTSEARWQKLANKPTPVSNIGAAVVDGRLYIPGGMTADNLPSDVHEVYDPAADRWQSAAPLPQPLCAYAVAAVPDGYYLLGGWDGTAYLDTVYFYDAAADAWRDAGRLTAPRAFAAAAELNGLIYLAGGYNGEQVLANLEVFNPSSGGWRTLDSLIVPRAGLGLAALNGSLYAVGGGWQRSVASAERYDLTSQAWSAFEAPFIGPWRSLGLSVLDTSSGTYLAALGGWNDGLVADMWFYQAMYRIYVP